MLLICQLLLKPELSWTTALFSSSNLTTFKAHRKKNFQQTDTEKDTCAENVLFRVSDC
jgi:hypothetical protein